MRRIVLFLTLAVLLLALPLAVAADGVFPDIIPLEPGLTPEGITEGIGATFYYGTLSSGDIYRGNYRTGEYEMAVDAPAGRVAVGMSFDPRSSFIYVSSAFAGEAHVYDVTDGSEVATIPLTAPFTSFINDAFVTRDAVYFTDSFQPMFYRVALTAGGELSDPVQVDQIPLGGDFQMGPDFNANGIVATPDGSSLIIVNSSTGQLFRVDPLTGYATLIDLGGASLPAGDGLVLRGKNLYVVQNALNQISVVVLSPDLMTGTIESTLTNPAFRSPTTAAIFGNALYAVNARFGDFEDPLSPPPDAEFEAVRVEIKP